MTLYSYQAEKAKQLPDEPLYMSAWDPGTGKTLTFLHGVKNRKNRKRVLVLAPKSILQPAWGDDIDRHLPELTYTVDRAERREKSFQADTEILVTNHDAIVWLANNPKYIKQFDEIIVDESAAFKHRGADRSRALAKVTRQIPFRRAANGTLMSQGLTELWHQYYILDHGERLGPNYYQFERATHRPVSSHRYAELELLPGALEVVAARIKDITSRKSRAECVELPPNHQYMVQFQMPAKMADCYHRLKNDALLDLDAGRVTAVNAAVLYQKLLQVASGAVYDDEGDYQLLDTSRYELIADLIEARERCVVAFNWRHQKEQLAKVLNKRKFSYVVFDGTVSDKTDVVHRFQAGGVRVALVQPKSGSHGLTLTAATSTIWASPTSVPDWFTQLNYRIDRIGQDRPTETVLTHAAGTLEERVYKIRNQRLSAQALLLELLHETQHDHPVHAEPGRLRACP